MLANVNRLGAYFLEQLRRIDGIKEVRGFGLMLGLELDERFQRPETPGGKMPSQRVVIRLMENGLLAVPAGPTVIRLLPPLNVRQDEVDQAFDILRRTLGEW